MTAATRLTMFCLVCIAFGCSYSLAQSTNCREHCKLVGCAFWSTGNCSAYRPITCVASADSGFWNLGGEITKPNCEGVLGFLEVALNCSCDPFCAGGVSCEGDECDLCDPWEDAADDPDNCKPSGS